jgi:hypothetical protein
VRDIAGLDIFELGDPLAYADPSSTSFLIAGLEQFIGALGGMQTGGFAIAMQDQTGAGPNLSIFDH